MIIVNSYYIRLNLPKALALIIKPSKMLPVKKKIALSGGINSLSYKTSLGNIRRNQKSVRLKMLVI